MCQMYSPLDPVFFLHHSYYDYLWWQWQRKGTYYFNAYGGRNSNGRRAYASDAIPAIPFSSSTIHVSDLFDTRTLSSRYCYTYLSFSGSSASKRFVENEHPTSTNGTEFFEEEIDWNSPGRSPNETLLFAWFAEKLARPLKGPVPLPDSWLDMNKIDKELYKEHFATKLHRVKSVNDHWLKQRNDVCGGVSALVGEQSAPISQSSTSDSQNWPIWAIVVTAISSVAIVLVISLIIVIFTRKSINLNPSGSDDKFQRLT